MKKDLILSSRCEDCPINRRAICSRCTAADFKRLDEIKTYRLFKAGETIFRRAHEMRFVANVVEGVATLRKTLEDGRTQTVGLLLPADFIGHPGRTRIEFDVIAASDVLLCSFEREAFRALLDELPHISQRMIESAMNELDAARDWMLLLGRKNASEKIATFIEMVVRRQHFDHPGQQRKELVLPLSRGDIANYLGMTDETVSRQIRQLKTDGILEFVDTRRFRVINIERLQLATGDDDDGSVIY